MFAVTNHVLEPLLNFYCNLEAHVRLRMRYFRSIKIEQFRFEAFYRLDQSDDQRLTPGIYEISFFLATNTYLIMFDSLH